ncbi:MAG: fibronectin type III domain-containing protein [Bacteroidales bacterium]|nr:fibronectin type III domain-containing protein [Bacteroidales bacterium]
MRLYPVIILLCTILIAGGCTKSDDGLAAPKGVKIVELTEHSVTIEWKAVKNATHYRWDLDSSDLSSGGSLPDTHFSTEILKPGTLYHFKVRAEDNTRTIPADGGDYPFTSAWTKLDFTTPGAVE